MVFTSAIFIFVFLPITLLLYYLTCTTRKICFQNIVLLVASLVFYSWGGVQYTFLLVASTVVNYILGILIDGAINKRKCLLIVGVLFNVIVLGIFKYFNFFVSVWEDIIHIWNPNYSVGAPIIPLPIGISFFTFQILSYLIDVYRKNVKVQKNVIYLGLYIMLFPQLIAGPIVRYIDVEREIKTRKFSLDMVYEGIIRFMIGFSKKVILSNTTGSIADAIFAQEAYINTAFSWIGIIAYALQIYLDFSAYSDMAIGLGKMFGFHFLENFNYPYISQSIQEFWRRWHISLSSWFRDYVYIPLGGNRKGTIKTYRNLIIVFLLTGFWHGASWNFIIWGAWYGVFLILERIGLIKILEKLPRLVRHVYALLIILIGWVFFRAEDLGQAFAYLKSMFLFNFSEGRSWEIFELFNTQTLVYSGIAIIACLPMAQLLNKLDKHHIVRDVCVLAAFVLAIGYLIVSGYNPFIYFRF